MKNLNMTNSQLQLIESLKAEIELYKRNNFSTVTLGKWLNEVVVIDLPELESNQVYKIRSAAYNNASYEGNITDAALRVEENGKLIRVEKILKENKND